MHREKRLARLLETLEYVLSARDLTLQDQRGDLLVELGQRLRNLASTADEALDGEAALEDLLEVLQ